MTDVAMTNDPDSCKTGRCGVRTLYVAVVYTTAADFLCLYPLQYIRTPRIGPNSRTTGTGFAMMAHLQLGPCPLRLASLKEQIATLYPDFDEHITRAWDDLLGELKTTTEDIARLGPDVCRSSSSSPLAN